MHRCLSRKGSISTFCRTGTTTKCLGIFDFEFANPKTTRIYVATLKAGDQTPFPPLRPTRPPLRKISRAAAEAKTDDKDKKKESDKAKNADKDKGDEKKDSKYVLKDFKIDLEGIQKRIVSIPMPPVQIRWIAAGKGMGSLRDRSGAGAQRSAARRGDSTACLRPKRA